MRRLDDFATVVVDEPLLALCLLAPQEEGRLTPFGHDLDDSVGNRLPIAQVRAGHAGAHSESRVKEQNASPCPPFEAPMLGDPPAAVA